LNPAETGTGFGENVFELQNNTPDENNAVNNAVIRYKLEAVSIQCFLYYFPVTSF